MISTWKNAGAAGGGKKAQAKEDDYYGMKVRTEQGVYIVYTPNYKGVARILMPNDNQLMLNGICLSEISRILAVRWGIIKGTISQSSGCYGCACRQIDVSIYEIYVPFNGGIKVADIYTPPDGRYVMDCKVLTGICKVVAKRYNM